MEDIIDPTLVVPEKLIEVTSNLIVEVKPFVKVYEISFVDTAISLSGMAQGHGCRLYLDLYNPTFR